MHGRAEVGLFWTSLSSGRLAFPLMHGSLGPAASAECLAYNVR